MSGTAVRPRPWHCSTRLLVAGHSLSFFEPIARLAEHAGASVRIDHWQAHGTHDEADSASALAWADVIHCEWCLGNAVWFSRERQPEQRLVVRFHRMELETPYPREIDMEHVDAMVFVAQHVLERACEHFGWDPEDPRFQVVPNGVDASALSTPKPPEADFTLAVLGYVPRLKHLDRALDILDSLRARDERYRLLIKGRAPWEYEWMAGRSEERRYFTDLLRRIERSPNLRRAVTFELFDNAVPSFLSQAGWILSTSEVEGHSVALAEGMASGAIPVVLQRPGAREQYEARWVHANPSAAAEAILATAARGEIDAEGEAARRFAERWDWGQIGPVWDRLLLHEAPIKPLTAA